MKDFYKEDFTPGKEVEDTRKWKEFQCLWIGKTSVVHCPSRSPYRQQGTFTQAELPTGGSALSQQPEGHRVQLRRLEETVQPGCLEDAVPGRGGARKRQNQEEAELGRGGARERQSQGEAEPGRGGAQLSNLQSTPCTRLSFL